MSKKQVNEQDDEMSVEYDFSDAEVLSFRDRVKEGVSITIYAPNKEAFEDAMPEARKFVLLDPDVADRFPDALTVNAALRSYMASH